MDIPVLYEDEQLVIIEKPVGVVCNRAESVKVETLQDWNEGRIAQDGEGELYSYYKERSGLVHRLDKDTSGVMVMAKTPEAFGELLRQFKEREVKKEYLALTHGIWSPREGVVNLPVGRTRHNRKMMGVREDGRESETGYRVEREYRTWVFPRELKIKESGYQGFSLVRFSPKTGRMHQIRVHAKHHNHPLVGDVIYGGRKRSREDRKWAQRLMLHAAKLEFTHPTSKKRVSFESDGELKRIIEMYLRE